jgi:hypothetical protein
VAINSFQSTSSKEELKDSMPLHNAPIVGEKEEITDGF